MSDSKIIYNEVYSFLNILPDYERNKIPQDVQNVFKYYKDNSYEKILDHNKPISEQQLQDETLNIIAMLNVDYLCSSEIEKEFYMNCYEQNELTYLKKININNIFQKRKNKNSQNATQQNCNTNQITEYKRQNIVKQFLSRLKKFFRF